MGVRYGLARSVRHGQRELGDGGKVSKVVARGYSYANDNPITFSDSTGLDPAYANCTTLASRNYMYTGVAPIATSLPTPVIGPITASETSGIVWARDDNRTYPKPWR